MTNELTVLDTNNLPSFINTDGEAGELTSSFMAGLEGGGLNMPTLSIRGKEFSVRKDGQSMPITEESYLDVILVDARENISKRYFPGDWDEGSAPVCSSTDGKAPDTWVDEPQSEACKTCPFNEFGSSENGKGKACSDYKRVIVVPVLPDGSKGEPCVLDIPATSLRTKRGGDGKTVQFREYVHQLARAGVAPVHVVTRLRFERGIEYPRLCFAAVRVLTEEEFQTTTAQREDEDVRDALAGRADTAEHTTEPQDSAVAAIQGQTPPSGPEPKKEAKKPEPKKEAKKPEPKKEAKKPEPAADVIEEDDDEIDALLGEIDALL